MAKSLVFQLGKEEIALAMTKVDRSKLYGYKEIEVVDESERPCELATLAEDGRTVIGKGGTAMAYLSVDGDWCERNEIKPVNLEGDEISPVGSSFTAPIRLEQKVSIEDYLEHNIRLIYHLDLTPTAEDDPAANAAFERLRQQLLAGVIFQFPYSYRGGLEADVGFLLMNETEHVFFLVGDRTRIELISLQQSAAVVGPDADSTADSESLMDFGMI